MPTCSSSCGATRSHVIDRIPDCSRVFEDLGIAVQVLPWTEEELTARLADRDPFAAQILRTGKVLAGGGQDDVTARITIR
jgi:hypothetical protein